MARVISGILALPRVSRNGVFYWPQELAKFDGQHIPLRFNHIKTPDGIVGDAELTYDPDKMQVKYRAEITNPEVQKLVDNHNFQVSLGAKVQNPENMDNEKICHPNGECFPAPILKAPSEMSIVETPGMPESTLNIEENNTASYVAWTTPNSTMDEVNEDIRTFYITNNTSNEPNKEKDLNMAEKSSKSVEEKTKITIETDGVIVTPTAEVTDSSDKEKDEIQHPNGCPPGQHKVDGKCVPQGEPKENTNVKKEDCGCQHAATEPAPVAITSPLVTPHIPTEDELQKQVDQRVDAKLEKTLDQIKEKWIPASEVKESGPKQYVEESYTAEEATKLIDHLKQYGYVSTMIDKDEWIDNHMANVDAEGNVTEAVATSGTIPGVKLSTKVVLLPAGKIIFPIRQFIEFQSIPVGQDTARFYQLSHPNFGAITESVTTDITASTHTLTSIDVTANVRGLRQQILKSQLEDFPAEFLNAVRNQIRAEAIKDETNLVLTTMGGTANDFGGLTGAPAHIGGDGTATTTATEEDAEPTLSKAGIARARRLIEADGYSVNPGNVVAFIHPLAYEALLLDTNISTLIENALPSSSTTGIIERYLGIQLIITNELANENNAFRNIVMVKKAAVALVSQREMELEMNKEIKGQWIDIVGTHRIGTDELDKNAYVIISVPDT